MRALVSGWKQWLATRWLDQMKSRMAVHINDRLPPETFQKPSVSKREEFRTPKGVRKSWMYEPAGSGR